MNGHYSGALKADGSAWCWGYNDWGMLGDNTDVHKSSPVAVVGSHSFKSLFCAGDHTLGIKEDGGVWAWGAGGQGQLGDNTATTRSSPVPVVGNHSFIKSQGDAYNSMGLKANGEMWTWGYNNKGELGDDSYTTRSSPVPVVGNHSFVDAWMGSGFAGGLKKDGSLWTWGANGAGQLGNNEALNSYSSPIAVVGSHTFTSFLCAVGITMALKSDGSLWTWGSNNAGELGDNSTSNRSSPVAVVGAHSFIRFSGGSSHSIALKSNGEAWTWGSNQYGQLGNNEIGNSYSSPVAVVGNHVFIDVFAGSQHSYGLKADGSVWTWGYNFYGQLGNNDSGAGQEQSSPVLVVGSHSFKTLYTRVPTWRLYTGDQFQSLGFVQLRIVNE